MASSSLTHGQFSLYLTLNPKPKGVRAEGENHLSHFELTYSRDWKSWLSDSWLPSTPLNDEHPGNDQGLMSRRQPRMPTWTQSLLKGWPGPQVWPSLLGHSWWSEATTWPTAGQRFAGRRTHMLCSLPAFELGRPESSCPSFLQMKKTVMSKGCNH